MLDTTEYLLKKAGGKISRNLKIIRSIRFLCGTAKKIYGGNDGKKI